MKQSVSLFKNISLVITSLFFILSSCSKSNDAVIPGATFAGQYEVTDATETYVLQVENKGGNSFQIKEFGGFLNAALKAEASGNTLTIPSQTFKNPNGSTITIVGTGVLSTKNTKDDTITFHYTVSGFSNYDGEFVGKRK